MYIILRIVNMQTVSNFLGYFLQSYLEKFACFSCCFSIDYGEVSGMEVERGDTNIRVQFRMDGW